MKSTHRTGTPRLRGRRMAALTLAAALAAGIPVAAAEPIGNGVTPTYDEAYYATLDYYGNLTEGSVVKSYTLNGAATLTDHGVYDEVVNLTDGTVPQTADGTTTFRFDDNSAPSHFYFEGKTAAPFEALPWTLTLSYTLNGVPTKAEDLAGKTGVVEIKLDIVPNEKASDYAKNNYTLEAMALFNQDDILSLEAPGAQVQLVGNLRAVLFLALPGEEQHFTIRVGADSFTFDGMTFLMVPATLSQLDEISKLSERKDDLEENYDKLSDSLDTLLDAVSGMSGSLYATANGLDQLNTARGTISGGKGQVYTDLDVALGDLQNIATALEPLEGHLETASQAMTDINEDISALCDKAVSLKTQLTDLRDALDDLDEDLENLQSGKGSLGALRIDLNDLGKACDGLKSVFNGMNSSLSDMNSLVGGLSGTDEIKIDGMTVGQIQGLVQQVNDAHSQYEGYLAQNGLAEEQLPFKAFLMGTGKTEEDADDAVALYEKAQNAEFKAQIEQAQSINELLEKIGMTVSDMKKLVSLLDSSTSPLLTQLSKLCYALGSDGLSGTLDTLLYHADSTLDNVRDLGDVIDESAQKLSDALDLLSDLNTTVNAYIPKAQQALADGKTLAAAATAGTKDLHTFLTSLETLMKQSGGQLDSGTKQTLEGLSATLRKAASSLSTTGDVKSAKNNISDIIEDTWNDYTGDVNNLLNMDSTAKAVSLTSSENPSPTTVQILIRSQEIKEQELEEPETKKAAADNGTFWSRVAQMFRDFWHAITGIFH